MWVASATVVGVPTILAYDLDDTVIRDDRPCAANIELLQQLQEFMLAVPVTARPQRLAKRVLPADLAESGVFQQVLR